ncbi:MAG: hypothetical protein RMA76_34740 [Deltaproteobacteria bacterium]|jgi:hypothetical protein
MALSNNTQNYATNGKQQAIKTQVEQQAKLLQSKILIPKKSTPTPTAQSSSSSAELAMQTGSIEDFLLISLGEVADGARQDMVDFKKRLDANTKHQNLLRDLRSLARSKDKSDVQDFIKAHPELKNSELIGKFKSGSIDWDALSEDIDGELESLNGISSSLSFAMQVIATRVTQAENLASTLFKKVSDSANQIIGNI